MTLVKIGMVGAALFALLVVAKTEHWLARAGIVARCVSVQAPYGKADDGQWWSCHEGLLTGLPTLERNQCTSEGFLGKNEIWYCPTPLESTPGF